METEGHAREAKQKAIIDCLKRGGTRRDAYRIARTTHDSFYRWLKDDLTFSEAVLRAEAEAEFDDLKLIRSAAKTDWRAAAWVQEHHPQRRDEWKKAHEFKWSDLPPETILAVLAASEGDPGAESAGDRMAAEAES